MDLSDRNLPINAFLARFKAPPYVSMGSHQDLTGGKWCVPDCELDNLYALWSNSFRQRLVPSLAETFSIVHPVVVDLDLEVPVEVLDETVVRKLAATASEKVRKFYPSHGPLECVVTKRTGDAPRGKKDPERFRHGVHLCWPEVLVKCDAFRRVRASIVAGLEGVDWSADLGAPMRREDWIGAVDASIHSLRMVGAPKAAPCPCRKGGGVCLCRGRNNYRVIDPNVYDLCTVLRGDAVDEGRVQALSANPVRLVKATSVRRSDGTPETPGYVVYVGAPQPDDYESGSGAGGKRRRRDDAARVGVKYRRRDAVTNPRVLEVMRALLVAHSEHYRDATLQVRYDGETSYVVLLAGDGSRYCLNKRDEHQGNHVYMVVDRAKGGGYESYMQCFCPCVVTRAGGVRCNQFNRKPLGRRTVPLSDAQKDRLFPKASTSARAQLDALEEEIRKMQESLG